MGRVLGVPGTRDGEAVVNGVRLHYVEAGAGPLVVLLHGFPEFWYTWRHQIPALAGAGFHVVAPDLRGYNTSEKPAGVAAYDVGHVVADVAALIGHFGAPRAHVVGHDWGAYVAWYLAMRYPQTVARLAVLNGPHPALFVRALRRPRQTLRSWYVGFFQLPWLPELVCRAAGYYPLRQVFRRDPARPEAYTEVDVQRTVCAMARPGVLTATINYYRAAWRLGARRRAAVCRPVDRPVLVIWGDRDRYLGPELAEGLGAWAPRARLEHVPWASHWVHNDAPAEVNHLLTDFLR